MDDKSDHDLPSIWPQIAEQPLHQAAVIRFTQYFFFLRHVLVTILKQPASNLRVASKEDMESRGRAKDSVRFSGEVRIFVRAFARQPGVDGFQSLLLALMETPVRAYSIRRSTSAEFFDPKAMQLQTACSICAARPTSGT